MNVTTPVWPDPPLIVKPELPLIAPLINNEAAPAVAPKPLAAVRVTAPLTVELLVLVIKEPPPKLKAFATE